MTSLITDVSPFAILNILLRGTVLNRMRFSWDLAQPFPLFTAEASDSLEP